MRRLRRLSLTLLVWLTAAATLVAGTPRLVCTCPNGRVKPYCFGSADSKTGCCCGGECCGNACGPHRRNHPEQPVTTPACCGHCSCCGSSAAPQKSGPLVSSRCCARSTARPDPSTIPSSDRGVAKATSSVLLLTPGGSPHRHPDPVAADFRQRPDHQRPPPTDLVIAFQHFLI
jgi:hypothetical protein